MIKKILLILFSLIPLATASHVSKPCCVISCIPCCICHCFSFMYIDSKTKSNIEKLIIENNVSKGIEKKMEEAPSIVRPYAISTNTTLKKNLNIIKQMQIQENINKKLGNKNNIKGSQKKLLTQLCLSKRESKRISQQSTNKKEDLTHNSKKRIQIDTNINPTTAQGQKISKQQNNEQPTIRISSLPSSQDTSNKGKVTNNNNLVWINNNYSNSKKNEKFQD